MEIAAYLNKESVSNLNLASLRVGHRRSLEAGGLVIEKKKLLILNSAYTNREKLNVDGDLMPKRNKSQVP